MENNHSSGKEEGEENKVVLVSVKDEFCLQQDVCAMCGAFGQDQEGRLIACAQCGHCYHPFCANVKQQYPVQPDQQTINSKFHPAVQAHPLPQPHILLQNVNSNRESTLQQNIYPSNHHSEINYFPAYSNPVGPAPSATTRGFGESQAMSTPSVYGIDDGSRKVSFRQDEPNVGYGMNDGSRNVSFRHDEPISGFGMDDGSRKVSLRQDEPNVSVVPSISQTSVPSHRGTIGTSLPQDNSATGNIPRENSMVRTSYKDEPQVINYSPGKEFNEISAYTVERKESSTVCNPATSFTHTEPIVNQIALQEMNHEEVPRELDRKYSAPERNSKDYALNAGNTKSETVPTTRVSEITDTPFKLLDKILLQMIINI